MKNSIKIRGAKENNLKNIDLELPKDKLVVFTGDSGSGKSSLAFGTIFAEGQRRYIESLSSYARQFLGQAQKPDVESIEGLSPAISIDQKTTNQDQQSGQSLKFMIISGFCMPEWARHIVHIATKRSNSKALTKSLTLSLHLARGQN